MEQVCSDCGKMFPSKKHLSDHIGVHDKTVLKCEECGMEVIGRKKMHNHLKLHILIDCKKCGTKMKANSITAHKTKCEDITYNCATCPYVSNDKRSLKAHIIKCGKEEVNIIHECLECGKKFNMKKHLTQHLESHNITNKNKTVYECNLCNKTFARNGILKDHMHRIHETKKVTSSLGFGLFVQEEKESVDKTINIILTNKTCFYIHYIHFDIISNVADCCI